jgi:periplasmic protein TonB
MSQDQQEKKNKRIGFLTSLGIHALLVIFFIFFMAWRAPDPPLPEYGMIINVGFDDEGSGDVQTDQPASEPDVQEDVPEVVEEQQNEPVVEDKPVDKVETEAVVTSKVESPVVVKEEEKKVVEKPKPKEPDKLKTEYKKEEPKEDAKPSDNKGEKKESEGDDKDKTGNKGQPDGNLDPNGQYKGKAGGGAGGDGMSLSMSGWQWAEQPKLPQLPDNEDGRIVFDIECDADGEIIGITTVERGLSPRAEQLLKEEIRKNSLVKTSGGQAPERSKGRVVFILKTR